MTKSEYDWSILPQASASFFKVPISGKACARGDACSADWVRKALRFRLRLARFFAGLIGMSRPGTS